MEKLLSVVIASRNREYYCIEAIKSILDLKSDLIEICISDNSESDSIQNYVQTLNLECIKYTHTYKQLSFIDNFNIAFGLATGRYLVNIGDDDSILPNIIHIARWAEENNAETVTPKNVVTYYWPKANPKIPEGYVSIPLIKDKFQLKNAKEELIILFKNGIVNYMFYDVPKIYHGMVRRDVMEKIKNITGNYFGGLSPDIFSVICLALVSEKHYTLDQSFTIAGVCPTSGSADQIKGLHCGTLEEMPHTKNRAEPYFWDKDIPEFYSVSTIWGDSALNAIESMKQPQYRSFFNRYPLLAQSLLMNRNQILGLMIEKCEKLRKEKEINVFVFWLNVFVAIIILCFDKIRLYYRNLWKPKPIFVDKVTDIHKAITLVRNSDNTI